VSSLAPDRFTEAEYLALERASERKHEPAGLEAQDPLAAVLAALVRRVEESNR
jgi:hypothetical protein